MNDMDQTARLVSRLVVSTSSVLLLSAWSLEAQTAAPAQAKPPAATQKPPARPSTAKPAPSTAKPAAPTPTVAAAKPPAPPPPEDLHFKTVYTNGDQKTETVTYIKGNRERFEFQDMVLLKQHDQKRTIQIMKTANTYLVAPEGAPPAMPIVPGAAPAAPRPNGVVTVSTTIVDTGERKPAFGQQARHVKMMIDKQPQAGACDTSKMRIETDAWYIDVPKTIASQTTPDQAAPPVPGGCADQIQATSNGDPKAVGFPIEYKTTMIGDDGKPITSQMQITEFETTMLDAALFDIPPGMNAAMNAGELGKALSDANEIKLAATDAAPPPAPIAKTPGVIRIGVPEFTNKTQLMVDTRALRARLIQDLGEAKFEALPMATAAAADLQKHAVDQGYDYVLLAEVSELKVAKSGGLGGLMKAASGVAGARGGAAGVAAGAAGAAGAAAGPKENTESSLAVKLVGADGKQKLSTTTKGKDGSGFSLQTGLGLAKFAGTMYVGMFAGPQLMMRMNAMGISHLSGMGLMGDPNLLRYQLGGMSMMGEHRGVDTTANAAGFLVQQAVTMNKTSGFVGLPGAGPNYDESLGEAVQNAAKAVQKALQK
jgi:hypothetical protein